MSINMKNLAESERPYEKALTKGIQSLGDAELLAVILRSGTKDVNALELSQRVLSANPLNKGLSGLSGMLPEQLMEISGIGKVKAVQLLAVTELANRLRLNDLRASIQFQSPSTIAAYYQEKCRAFTAEHTFLMLFDNAFHLIKELSVSRGTVNQALISPREIFIEALRYQAVNLVLVHNHPSGLAKPSAADIAVTKKIRGAGELLDIHLSDHIIVAGNSYLSFLEQELF